MLYFNSNAAQQQILYFLLHYIYLTATVAGYIANLVIAIAATNYTAVYKAVNISFTLTSNNKEYCIQSNDNPVL